MAQGAIRYAAIRYSTALDSGIENAQCDTQRDEKEENHGREFFCQSKTTELNSYVYGRYTHLVHCAQYIRYIALKPGTRNDGHSRAAWSAARDERTSLEGLSGRFRPSSASEYASDA